LMRRSYVHHCRMARAHGDIVRGWASQHPPASCVFALKSIVRSFADSMPTTIRERSDWGSSGHCSQRPAVLRKRALMAEFTSIPCRGHRNLASREWATGTHDPALPTSWSRHLITSTRRARAALTMGALATAATFALTLGPATAFAATPSDVADNGGAA